MPSVNAVDLAIHWNRFQAVPLTIATQAIPNISAISLVEDILSNGAIVVEELAHLFRQLNLRSISIGLPTASSYAALPSILSVIETLTMPVTIVFDGFQRLEMSEVLLLSGAFRLPFDLEFCNIFVHDDAAAHFCDAVRRSNANSLSFTKVDVHGTSFANALTSSQVSSIRINGRCNVIDYNLEDFLVGLAEGIPTMPAQALFLEHLLTAEESELEEEEEEHLKEDREDDYMTTEEQLPRLVERAAMHPNLRHLGVPSLRSSYDLDRSLALLVRKGANTLDTLTLFAEAEADTDSEPAEPAGYPIFLRALKDNFTIQEVHLIEPSGGLDVDDLLFMPAWDGRFRVAVGIITRLNRSGRSYLQTAATCQRIGFGVLERVNDCLNCLFFHLRENPALCRRREAQQELASGERKRQQSDPILSHTERPRSSFIHRR